MNEIQYLYNSALGRVIMDLDDIGLMKPISAITREPIKTTLFHYSNLLSIRGIKS